MKIIENFLPPSLLKNVKSEILGDNFSWYFNDSIAYDDTSKNNFQFTHTFYKDQKQQSNWYALVHSFLYVVELKFQKNLKGIVRIKANLNPQNPLIDPLNNIHQDMPDGNFMTLLYYVNDSDGDTLMFDQDKKTIINRITPEENKAIWFESKNWHCSSPPVKNKRRVVINFILELE